MEFLFLERWEMYIKKFLTKYRLEHKNRFDVKFLDKCWQNSWLFVKKYDKLKLKMSNDLWKHSLYMKKTDVFLTDLQSMSITIKNVNL